MIRKVKTFKERTSSSIVDNLLIMPDSDNINCINIRVTCGRDGYLVFSKKQVLSIAKYLNEIAKE